MTFWLKTKNQVWTDKTFARAAGCTTKTFAKVQIIFVNNINCKKYFKFYLIWKIKWLPSGAIFSNPTCNVGWKQGVQTMACQRHALSKIIT